MSNTSNTPVLLLALPILGLSVVTGCDAPEDEARPSYGDPADDLQDHAAGVESPCSVGWYTIDCHANETTLSIDGVERTVLWQVPSGEAPAGGWPVVLAFHGTNDPAAKFFDWNYYNAFDQYFGGYYQMKTTQALLDNGFAVLAPKARSVTGGIYWDTNIPPHAENWDDSPDAAFMDRLLEEIEDGTFGPLDDGSKYAMGLSSGGYQSSRMAVAYPSEFEAIAIQSASYATCISSFPCDVSAADLPANHAATLLMAGVWDTIVPLYTIESYSDALDDNGTDVVLEVVNASHQWTSSSPGWVLEWFQTH